MKPWLSKMQEDELQVRIDEIVLNAGSRETEEGPRQKLQDLVASWIDAASRQSSRRNLVRVRSAFTEIYGGRGVRWTDDLERIIEEVLKDPYKKFDPEERC